MNLNEKEETQVFDFLMNKGCCLKCCLRFLGLKTRECYENPIDFAKRHYGYVLDGDDPFLQNRVCIACLGILQRNLEEEIIQRVQETVKEEGFDCETFTCGLMLPLSINLRERLLQTHCINELCLRKDTLSTLKLKLQSVKDAWKIAIVPKLEQAIKKRAELIGTAPFLIEIVLSYANDEKEYKELLDACKGEGNVKRKRNHSESKLSRKGMEVLMAEISDDKFFQYSKDMALEVTSATKVEQINCSHTSIFIGGRYAKFSRQLSQTPWFINGEKRMETSVQDILCKPIANVVKSRMFKFLSSGREDVDVRNINAGRPFAIEFLDPRMTNMSDDLLSGLVDEINKSSKQVQITSCLKVLSRADLKKLKDGENAKTKIYRALCVCRETDRNSINLEKLNGLKRVKIIQKTPIRVLHRRPLSPRMRFIYEMRARWASSEELKMLLNTATESSDMFFVLDMKTQAGTYVKEFVHGDFGRTKPSLCDLLRTEVDIVALDVTGINLDWP